MQKLNKRQVLNYLIEYIIFNLNEFNNLSNLSDFEEGTILTFIDCLEILSKWHGFQKFGITDIESYFGIK